MQSKLAQCQADKESVTVNRDELQAARTELVAQLATIEAKVGPLKTGLRFSSIYSKNRLLAIHRCQCIAVGLLAIFTQCSNAHWMVAIQQSQAGPCRRLAAQEVLLAPSFCRI